LGEIALFLKNSPIYFIIPRVFVTLVIEKIQYLTALPVMTAFSTNFIIADAHCVYRGGLSTFLKQHFAGCIITEAAHADNLLAAAAQQWFDVILINVRLQPTDGFETARCLKQLYALLHGTIQCRTKWPAKAACLCLRRGCIFLCGRTRTNYSRKIEDVLQKGFSISAENFKTYQREHKRLTESMKLAFTRREKEISRLLLQGFTSKQMADELFVSPKTIDNHRHRLLHKTNCHNTAQLLRFLYEMGWEWRTVYLLFLLHTYSFFNASVNALLFSRWIGTGWQKK
jgi:two-component system response regulator DegU